MSVKDGHDIPTIRELLEHKDSSRSMIYTPIESWRQGCQKPDELELKSQSMELGGNSLTRILRAVVLTTAWD